MRRALFLLCFAVAACSAAPAPARTSPHAIIPGVASWYGAREGKVTASGQGFHARGMTAASRTLPFGTRLRVTSRDTGLAVEVVVNDRGPYISGRNLDLTPAAMAKIGGVHRGVVPVVIEILPSLTRTPL